MSHSAAISACDKGLHWDKAFRLLQEMLHRSLVRLGEPQRSHQRVREGQALGEGPSLAAGDALQIAGAAW